MLSPRTLLLASLLSAGCAAAVAPPAAPAPATAATAPSRPDSVIRFDDVAAAAGVRFRHADGASPRHLIIETLGAGIAWLDYDRDGLPDLYFAQGGPFPVPADPGPNAPGGQLFRNLGGGRFADVTAKALPPHPGYHLGVTACDYDNDGYPDFFVAGYDRCRLFHNEPDGAGGRRFADASAQLGAKLDGFCSACAFGDFDADGWPDLYVGRYVQMDLAHYPECVEKNRVRPAQFTCGPGEFAGSPPTLLMNNRDGTFRDASAGSGLSPDAKALGVVVADLDADGRPDLFVGNDEVVNHHHRNLGGGKFENVGSKAGTAMTADGRPMASMGVECADFTGDGRPDIFITTFFHERTVLFRNNGGFFADVSRSSGMYGASWDKIGWGVGAVDADLDGAVDLFVANGHVYRNAAELVPPPGGKPDTFELMAQMFRGDGRGQFREVSATAGAYFGVPHPGRAVAACDFDNDGRVDLAVGHVGADAALLRNVSETPHRWVRLVLEGAAPKPGGACRDAVGASVTVSAGGRKQVLQRRGGGSYYSSPDKRLTAGLGDAGRVDEVVVRWPNAAASFEAFGPFEAGSEYVLREGAGRPAPGGAR